MFNELQAKVTGSIFDLHPIQLSGYLEAVWEAWRALPAAAAPAVGVTPAGPLNGLQLSPTMPKAIQPGLGLVTLGGTPAVPTFTFTGPLLQALQNGVSPSPFEAAVKAVLVDSLVVAPGKLPVPPFWRHVSYPFLVENTRAYEIFKKIVAEAVTDETFGLLSEGTHRWLRTTEELFFRTSSAYFMSPVMSAVRLDSGAMRRGLYRRFLDMDLNHGAPDGGAYPYPRAQTANTDFVKTLQELLRELWRGYVNSNNQFGQNTTDDSNIAELINRLKTQLNARREISTAGNFSHLLREEFDAYACLSWFELSLAPTSPVVVDLKIGGGAPEEILRKLGERAKIPSHGKARNLFFLARDLPTLLRNIELGVFDNSTAVKDLYKNPGPVLDAALRIINHWYLATGANLKEMPAAPGAR